MALSGRVIADRYTIEREIGHGGMATVWLADDPQHGRKVAIKTMHPEFAGAIGIDRFLREIQLTARLQHPGIVPILDSGAIELSAGTTVPWYAMPFLVGESLRDRLDRETQLSIEEALRITQAVGDCLEAAHQQDVIHRDIKPENIFLAGERVYVVDFGIARALAADADRLTSTGLAMGTPTYMSPEQAIAGTVDARSDQYSLASVLYEMLAGEPPFGGPNPQATISRRLAEPARPLTPVRSTVPAGVERAILKALERTPADRFGSVSAFVTALHAPAGAVAPQVTRTSRTKVLAAALAVAVLALTAWSVTSLRGRKFDPEVVALYQRGVQAYDRRTPAGVEEAVATLSNAIGRDSSYAPAWNALAKAYARAYQRGFAVREVPHAQLLTLAVNAVERSLSIDRNNADAWATHALVTQQVDPTDGAAPLRSIRRSLALDSTQAKTWHNLALMLADSGNLDAAMQAWRKSVALDPLDGEALSFIALGHYWRGAYDSASAWADSALHVDPTFILSHHTASLAAIEVGRFDEAESQAEAALRLSDGVEVVNGMALQALVKARRGYRPLAMATLLSAEVVSGQLPTVNPHTVFYLAQVYAALGDAPAALRTLGRYGTPRDRHFQLHLRCSPTFAPIEEDSAFQALLVLPRPSPGTHC